LSVLARSNTAMTPNTIRSALRGEINDRLLPALRALAFEGPPKISGNALIHEFTRKSQRGRDVLTIQFEKYGLPRFLIDLHVAPSDGLDKLIASGGSVIAASLKPRKGASSRHWFRADPTFWRRLRSPGRTFEKDAVELCIRLLPEVEAWWLSQKPSQHITTWRVDYPGTAAQRDSQRNAAR